MTIVMDEGGLRTLLRTHTGPVGARVERDAKRIHANARVLANAGGPPDGRPRVRTRDLLNNLRRTGPFPSNLDGPYWLVGTNAVHNGVAYPVLIELGGISKSGVFYRYPFLEPAIPFDFKFVKEG